MSERVLCRYFVHGACKKGASCPFSHSWSDQPSPVCTFYQRGICSFGDKCRYDHVRLPKSSETVSQIPRKYPLPNGSVTVPHSHEATAQTAAEGGYARRDLNVELEPVSSNYQEYNLPASLDSPYGELLGQSGFLEFDEGLPEGAFGDDGEGMVDDEFEDFQREAAEFALEGAALRQGLADLSTVGEGSRDRRSGFATNPVAAPSPLGFPQPFSLNPNANTFTSANAAWTPVGVSQASGYSPTGLASLEAPEGSQTALPLLAPEDRPLCERFLARGYCSQGDSCHNVHGELCSSCGKFCLHPHRPQEREEHSLSCTRSQRLLEALRRSQEVECGVCLERVLGKPKAAERKFGVLSGCDHAFCIACIRGWRGGTHTTGMDLDAVVRACPICRVQSHFVTPSVVWYFSGEEKEEIVKGYKKKLNGIDCRYFDFGDGNCPFGTSCFYKHAYRDGTKEEVKLRHLGAADGSTVIAKEVRLSDFLVPVLANRR